MFSVEDRSDKSLCENVVKAANKLNPKDLQKVCESCGFLIGQLLRSGKDRIDASNALPLIQVLKQFFTNDELNALLAWLGLVYDEPNNLLMTLIKKDLMSRRMSEFVSMIRARLPGKDVEDEKPQAIRKQVSAAAETLQKSKNNPAIEGTITKSSNDGRLRIKTPTGKYWDPGRFEKILKDCPLGAFVRVYLIPDRIIVAVMDN